mmetsp:Transcript_25128/g.62283  ORF Transcript_25128/g.62283 Transcript_25128/m.62283 type:complete len:461 (-) Transcript_25128:309-1691(-)
MIRQACGIPSNRFDQSLQPPGGDDCAPSSPGGSSVASSDGGGEAGRRSIIAAALSANSALVLHSFLAALVRLARARYGATDPISNTFERCWDAHFSLVASNAQRDGRLRKMLDSVEMTDLYYAYEASLKPIFEYHARLPAKLGDSTSRNAPVHNRMAIRKWIANRGPTIGFGEWQLFWAACWAAVDSEEALDEAPPPSPRHARTPSAMPHTPRGAKNEAENSSIGGVGAIAKTQAGKGDDGSGMHRGSLLAPALLQRTFLSAQSEEVGELARGSATTEAAMVDTQMTWKEFWEGLARSALDTPVPLLRNLHARNERILERMTIGQLRSESRPGSRVPAKLLAPVSKLTVPILEARMEVLLQTAIRAFADMWGSGARPSSSVDGAVRNLQLSAGSAAARAHLAQAQAGQGHAKFKAVRQVVGNMHATLAVRSVLTLARQQAGGGDGGGGGGCLGLFGPRRC